MILIICLLAFCFVPLHIANVDLAAPRLFSSFGAHLKAAEIAHGNAEDEDTKAINQFVQEIFMVAEVLYPPFAKAIGYSMITSVLLGDQTQITKNNQKDENEKPAWINEIAKTKEAIEKESDKNWANLLGKLRQIMDKAMRAFEESKNGEQNGKKRKIEEENAKIKEMQSQITEVIVVLAALDNISEKEIMEPLKEEIDQKRMLNELAQLWNQLKLDFEQKEDQKFNEDGKNHEKTKRMLKLIIHFPIEAIEGFAKSKKAKKNNNSRRRRRKINVVVFIGIFVLIGFMIVMGLCGGCLHFIRQRKYKREPEKQANLPDPQEMEQQQQTIDMPNLS